MHDNENDDDDHDDNSNNLFVVNLKVQEYREFCCIRVSVRETRI